LCHGHPPKTPYNYNIRDLSNIHYFSKLLIFPNVRDLNHIRVF
jgi:hypothetical protein